MSVSACEDGKKNGHGSFMWADGSSYEVIAPVLFSSLGAFSGAFSVPAPRKRLASQCQDAAICQGGFSNNEINGEGLYIWVRLACLTM